MRRKIFMISLGQSQRYKPPGPKNRSNPLNISITTYSPQPVRLATQWSEPGEEAEMPSLLALLLAVALLTHTTATDVVDFQQCDRQCRYLFGFYDRAITGIRAGALGNKDRFGAYCNCYKNNTSIGQKLKRSTLKPWNDSDFWCGPGGNASHPGFNTTEVCVQRNTTDAQVHTATREQAHTNKWPIVHCGKCSACSRPQDVQVLYDTRHFITTEMTRCAAKFAKPSILGGDHNLDHLRACLYAANITFDNTRRFATPTNQGHGPTCMECWTDNIMCDSTQCNTNPSCIEKFINPNNTGAFSGCLKCDEKHCGSEFIQCAGANRRSSGIISDIQRVGDEVCHDGWYWSCSQCHAKCGSNDQQCNAQCEESKSCQGPARGTIDDDRTGSVWRNQNGQY
jgi:hypothetical protein